MRFVERSALTETFRGKTVAVVGSGPGALANLPGLVDSHDIVVRVNMYKLFPATGYRTDVFYSYFGSVIKKRAEELQRDGVTLCIAKCPDAKFMDSPWHDAHRKKEGVDFRYIYKLRKEWWFCDTYIPTVDEFMETFTTLGGHVPTTGFAAIVEVLRHQPKHVFLTGFDFFTSGVHNVNEKWNPGDAADPIGHVPGMEREWLRANLHKHPITLDEALTVALSGNAPVPQRQTQRPRPQLRRR